MGDEQAGHSAFFVSLWLGMAAQRSPSTPLSASSCPLPAPVSPFHSDYRRYYQQLDGLLAQYQLQTQKIQHAITTIITTLTTLDYCSRGGQGKGKGHGDSKNKSSMNSSGDMNLLRSAAVPSFSSSSSLGILSSFPSVLPRLRLSLTSELDLALRTLTTYQPLLSDLVQQMQHIYDTAYAQYRTREGSTGMEMWMRETWSESGRGKEGERGGGGGGGGGGSSRKSAKSKPTSSARTSSDPTDSTLTFYPSLASLLSGLEEVCTLYRESHGVRAECVRQLVEMVMENIKGERGERERGTTEGERGEGAAGEGDVGVGSYVDEVARLREEWQGSGVRRGEVEEWMNAGLGRRKGGALDNAG